jgi:4-amino-4-deoxy-L-arabinose transferase-like glycosyltransferase
MVAVIDRLVQRPWQGFAALCLAQIVLWTLAPLLTHYAPPYDVLESYMWGREWLLGTHKHPPLPSWLLEASRVLTGSVTWPTYLLPQLLLVLTFGFVFRLGCDLMEGQRALAGTLLLTGIFFYCWPTPELNHNIVQLPIWSGMMLCLWRAPQAQSAKVAAFWWILCAVLAAALSYAKYSGAFQIVLAALWILLDPQSRRALRTPWPWIALAVFLALIAPGMLWLSANYEEPLRYAKNRAQGTSAVNGATFLFRQLICHSAMFVMLFAAGLVGTRRTQEALPLTSPPLTRRGWMFLLWFTAGQVALILVSVTISRLGLRGAWGAPLWLLSGLLAVAVLSDRFSHDSLVRLAVSAAVVMPTVAATYMAVAVVSPLFNSRPAPINWPQKEIAARMLAKWTAATDQPLRIVIGEPEAGGLVALTAPHSPSLMIHGSFGFSPWVTQARLDEQGALVVWRQYPDQLQPANTTIANFITGLPQGSETFEWPRRAKAPPIRLGYAVILPKKKVAPTPVKPAAD